MSSSWWKKSLGARPLARLLRNWSGPLIWTGTALTAGGCAEMWAEKDQGQPPAGLDRQEQAGWNIGSEGQPLSFVGAQAADMSGQTGWQSSLASLAPRLMPADPRWQPYYAPALFQSLEAPQNEELRRVIRPIYTPELGVAHRRGEALLSLFTHDGRCRQDVAVVLDVPGPEAVALAAALARCFDPVFVLDNWPHPKGIVPAHLTLGAALYFFPELERTRLARPPVAPPLFVLDRQRLVSYTDDAGQFDNRYFANLPSWEGLHAAGIRHLLYVTPDATTVDGDDINDDLVALDEHGIDVKILALTDLSQAPLPGWLESSSSLCGPVPAGAGAGPQYYFGGSPAAQACFDWWYGWELPRGSVSFRSSAGPLPPIPARLLPRCRFHPTPRAGTRTLSRFQDSGGWRGGAHGTHGVAVRSGSLGRAHGGFSA